MKEIKEFFNEIGRDDIDENTTNLLHSGIIDSMDIMTLISVIEKKYGASLNIDIESKYFDSFASIKQMINKAYKK